MNEEIKILTREDPNSHPIIKRVIEVLKSNNYTVTICSSISDFSLKSKYITFDPLYGALLSALRANFVLYSLEMFEHQVDSSARLNRLRNFIFHLSHKFSMKHSRLVVFCNKLRYSHYVDLGWVNPGKCILVRNYPQQQFLINADNRNKKKLSSMDGIKRFVYAGSIQSGRDLEVVIQSFATASRSVLLVAGKDTSGIFKDKDYKNVKYLGALQQDQVCDLLLECDYGILEYSNEILNTKYCAPMKVYEYYAAGLKIVCNCNFSMNHLLKGIGIVDYQNFNPDKLSISEQNISIKSFDEEFERSLLPNL